MTKITTTLVLVAVGLAWGATDCFAQRANGKEGRDPAKRVQQIIAQYDTDTDQKLDATELQAFLAALNQRRGQGNTQGQGNGKGRGKGNGQGKARGGKKAGRGEPQSPDMEGGKRGKREGRSGKKKPGGGTNFQGVTPNLPPAE